MTAVAFSPDATTLASASMDSTINLWDLSTGQLLTTLSGNVGAVRAIAYSPDGSTLASGGDDGNVRLWDVQSGQIRQKLSGASKVRCLAFSPNSQRLATGREDSTIQLWSVKTGDLTATFHGHKRAVLALAFTPNGNILASGSADQSLKLWSLARGCEMTPDELKHRGSHGAIRSLAFSPSGVELAMTTNDFVVLWEFSQLERRFALPRRRKGMIWSARYSPQGRLLATACGLDPANTARGKQNKGSSGQRKQVRENEIRLWDSATGRECGSLNGHTGPVRAIDFSPDGRQLASGSDDTTIMLWNVAHYQEFNTQPGLDALTASTANPGSPVVQAQTPVDADEMSDDDEDGPTVVLEIDGSAVLPSNRSKGKDQKLKNIRGLPERPKIESGAGTVFQYRAVRGVSGLGGGHTVGSGGSVGGGGGGRSGEDKDKKHD